MRNVWVSRYDGGEDPPAVLDEWARRLEVSPFIAELLWRRGATTLEDMRLFLNPGLRFLAPLETWPGLFDAAGIIADGVVSGKKLVVWGDYDVDGITSTALVKDFFRQHGFDIATHIPDRIGEGYGLNVPDLERLAAEGADIILTVDCGICDNAEIARARELGMKVVVSDHHLPGQCLPEADAICAPTINECPYPHLAGVGVAFMLMAGVNRLLEEKGFDKVDIRPLLDLVALGTLADVANLGGQNRILVKNGLVYLSRAVRPGIAALKTASNFAPDAELGAGQVVFTLAPRINAAGRMGRSEVALKLLLTNDREEAASLAAELDAMNQERRNEEDIILKSAREQAAQMVRDGAMGLVLYQADWHMGIIGIVASRIVEEFRRPTIVLCDNGSKIKGSGRSLDGFDLHAALSNCSELFITFGGHKMAAGLTLEPDKLADFRRCFDIEVHRGLGGSPPPVRIKTDGELSAEDTVNHTLLKELEMLQPFGMGNSEPVFISDELVIRDVRNRPGLSVIDLLDEKSGIVLKAKLWRPKQEIPSGSRGRRMRLAYSPRIDRYNGAANVELRVRDWYII